MARDGVDIGKSAGEDWRTAALRKPKLRGVSHLTMAFFSIYSGWQLYLRADAASKSAVLLYDIAFTLVFLVSGTLHCPTWPPATRQKLRQLDHSMIYLMIAATYHLSTILPEPPMILLYIGWLTFFLGVGCKVFLFNVVKRSKYAKVITVAPFLLAGWSCVLEIRNVDIYLPYITWAGIASMAVGGVCYSLGGICYAFKKPNPVPGVFGYHEILHIFVILADYCFYYTAWILVGNVAAIRAANGL
mmetsp:Transcript_15452/g.60411  ORF Transcript_15452/g.60411 Transcript_15452/m.60411 type:complete len:245 (-) Transcript_15452:101-835(-)